MVPVGSGGATIGKTIFTYVYNEKKSSPEPADQFQSNLALSYPWVKEIINCSNKGPGPLQRGDNYKNAKNGEWSFKNLLQNHLTRVGHIYMKAF